MLDLKNYKDYTFLIGGIMEFTGSKTENNLKTAFAGESQARMKYNYFSSQAKKDGYEQIAQIFEETAGNEKEHAKLWYKHLNGGSVPKTIENLIDAAAGEHGEWTKMYAQMAKEAKEEGFEDIAKQFSAVAEIEKRHEQRFLKLAKNIKENAVFNKENLVAWKCLNCGHIHLGNDAPNVCPVCAHPQSYFQVEVDNY